MVGYKNILFILLTFLFADCPVGYQEYYDSLYWGYSCYCDDDIEFLNALMDNNCTDYDENNEYTTIECVSGLDGDSNNDGIVQPIDFCNQWWGYNSNSDGLRLITLNCNHNQGLTGDGLIGTIPENIGNPNVCACLHAIGPRC